MAARRALHSTLAAAAMLIVLVTPVAAGKFACSLQATVFGGSATEVNVGEEVLIEGFDFPAGDVFVVYSVAGTPLPPDTVTADGAGTFETTITPAAGQEGLWDVEASDEGALCTATTSFLVLGVTPTATPSPAPTTPAPPATPPQGQLPNVVTPPPPSMPVWVLGVAVLALSVVTLRQAFNRRRS